MKFSLRDVEGSLPSFGDDSQKIPVDKWLEELDQNRELFQWTELEKLIAAKKLLKETARLWLDSQPTITTWKLFKAEIYAEFYKRTDSAMVHQELMKRKKKSTESIQEYVIIISGIPKKGNIEEQAVIRYIIDGIPDVE